LNIAPLTSQSIVEAFVSNDPGIAETITAAKLPDTFVETYSLKKYLLGFEDLFALEDSVLETIVSHLPNETVAEALMGLDSKLAEKALSSVNKLRRKIIDNLMNTTQVDKERVEEAQNKFLREFRRRNT
jgi:hypothetical protein